MKDEATKKVKKDENDLDEVDGGSDIDEEPPRDDVDNEELLNNDVQMVEDN